MIYLDNAATSFIKPTCVQQAVHCALNTMSSPGRGAYSQAMKAAETLFKCRQAAADLFGVDEAERIVFTSNASHGLNIAINSLVKKNSRVLMSGYEHNSVSRPLYSSGARIKIFGRKLFEKQNALDDICEEINSADVVVCTHVSNVFGYVLPIYEIADLCNRKGIPLIVDASQSAGILPVDQSRLKAAFIAMPGHKALFGPQGTGILICGHETKPLIYGGSGSDSIQQHMPYFLPDRLEAGTHNVPGIAGLLAGINFISEVGMDEIIKHENLLKSIMIDELHNTDWLVYAGNDQIGVVSMLNNNHDCEQVASILGEKGICVRAGLHCAPTAHESAGTIDTGTVRFSFSPFVTESQILYVCDTLKTL